MGEYSKTIGEAGENIVMQLLNLIGWGAAQSRIDIECNFPKRHRIGMADRRSHGLDYFHSVTNPLLGDVVDHIVISSKCTADPYPSVPTKLFKQHFDDLAKALECARTSELRREANARCTGANKSRDIGVLFWITLDRNSTPDVVGQITSCRDLTDSVYDTVYVVDNARAQFLLDAYAFAQCIGGGARVLVCYPDTGQNISPLRRNTEGSVLPVEYITSPVLPFRLISSHGSRTLALVTRDNFSKIAVQRLLDLAHRLTQSWASDIVIGFPDYECIRHSNDVQAAKATLADAAFAERVKVDSLKADLGSLANE